jgi:hypothetical protein
MLKKQTNKKKTSVFDVLAFPISHEALVDSRIVCSKFMPKLIP